MAQTIGETAAQFGVSLRTLRFYEDRGLVFPERIGAARIYHEKDLEELKFIFHVTKFGFSLREVDIMLKDARKAGHAPRLDLNQTLLQLNHLQEQKRRVEEAIKQLRLIQRIAGKETEDARTESVRVRA
jgi:DNA-binding transcriptional MerR regulator